MRHCKTLGFLIMIPAKPSSRQEYWIRLPCPPPGDLPNQGIEARSPTLQVDSLPTEPLGKPMNTGVGNLSLLQGIFPIQELNWGLWLCRQILYQLSYQGSPKLILECAKTFGDVRMK